jgi:hypothetical protein
MRDEGRTCSSFKVQGSRFKVQGSRFKVQGSRFKVQGSRFKVQGSRIGIDIERRQQFANDEPRALNSEL